ncbi:MAG: hypothetical protein ACI4LO_08070 [Anaerovoracaceae bacterium]
MQFVSQVPCVQPNWFQTQEQSNCYAPGIIIPDRVQEEMMLANVEATKEKAKTDGVRERANIELHKKEVALEMSYEMRENAEAEHLMTNIKVELEDDTIFVKIIGTNGRVRRKVKLIDGTFISAQKIIAINPKGVGVMIISFRINGHHIKCYYSISNINEKKEKILDVLKDTALEVNSSRRLEADINEKLPKVFEDASTTIILPYDVGYYIDCNGNWQLCKPGEATLRKVEERLG